MINEDIIDPFQLCPTTRIIWLLTSRSFQVPKPLIQEQKVLYRCIAR